MSATYHTPLTFASPLTSAALNIPLSQLDSAIGILNTSVTALQGYPTGASSFDQLNVGSATAHPLTIAIGAIAITYTRHRVDTEGSAAADDLDTINGGSTGDVLMIQSTSAARVITVKHNTGNIWLSTQTDRILDDPRKMLWLVYDSTASRWVEDSFGGSMPLYSPLGSSVVASSLTLPDDAWLLNPTIAGRYRLLLLPDGQRRRFFGAVAEGASPWVSPLNIVAPTVTGTGSATNAAESNYSNFASGGVAGNIGGINTTTFNYCRRSHNPVFYCRMRTAAGVNDLSNVRLWFGLSSAAGNTDTPTMVGAGFTYRTGTSDAGWLGWISNGGGTFSFTSSLSVIALDTMYDLRMRVDDSGGAVYFSVNGETEVSLSGANLPAASTDLGIIAYIVTTANLAKNIKISRVLVTAQ